MGRIIRFTQLFLVCLLLPVTAHAEKTLVPVGKLIGLHLQDGTVRVAEFDGQRGQAIYRAGVRVGDEILQIDAVQIHSASDVPRALAESTGKIQLTYRRGSKISTVPLEVQPGQRLGLSLRQGIAGVGTVTWYDPTSGSFGTLGHGVSNDRGVLLQLEKGDAYHASVTELQMGRVGQPGALKGAAVSDTPFGELLKNTPQGVFGVSRSGMAGKAVPVGRWENLHIGTAQIRSTVSGSTPKDYTVEITRIYPGRSDGRDMMLKVTDPELLGRTGGIVQGMSGSPILQDGVLIGAVTHVLVSEPTIGYGIFIGNMLDAAA